MAKRRKPAKVPMMLPSEALDASGVPHHLRADVAYRVLAAKYCALAEAAVAITGAPIAVSLERVKVIATREPGDEPDIGSVVLEEGHLTHGQVGIIHVRPATADEIRESDRRELLHRMGARRN